MDEMVFKAFKAKMIVGPIHKIKQIPTFVKQDEFGVFLSLTINRASIIGRNAICFLYENEKFWVILPSTGSTFLVNIPPKYIKTNEYIS